MAETRTVKTFTAPRSAEAASKIAELIPGGVNSPFRSFQEVGGHTIFFEKAEGPYLTDIDGNRYIDYLGAWGPAVLGHSPPQVVKACQEAVTRGAVFGTPHIFELEFAKLITGAFPSIEKIRFVNSGTEAVMSALRLARGFTGKDVIVMFEGCYHGHSDVTLASTGHRASSGIPESASANTVLATFNDLASVNECLERFRGRVAGIIVEPVAGSMSVIPPAPGFLQGIQKAAQENEALFILDEVLTGLRVARGGAQSLYGIKPDITCFGKALGGGMPIGAYGGRREIMDRLQPLGDVYQAGTFSGNPVTMAGGMAILKALDDSAYRILEERTAELFAGLKETIGRRSLPVQLQRVGSMFAIVFADKPVHNYRDSLAIDAHRFAEFFHRLLADGVNLPPSAVDAACVSSAHSKDDIERTVAAATRALNQIFD